MPIRRSAASTSNQGGDRNRLVRTPPVTRSRGLFTDVSNEYSGRDASPSSATDLEAAQQKLQRLHRDSSVWRQRDGRPVLKPSHKHSQNFDKEIVPEGSIENDKQLESSRSEKEEQAPKRTFN